MRQEKFTFIELRIYRIICFALNCSFQARATLIRALHTEYGSKLVDSLVRAAVLTLPSYTYHDIGDVLHECLQHDRASVCSWLEQCLKTLQSSESNSINSITQTQVARKFFTPDMECALFTWKTYHSLRSSWVSTKQSPEQSRLLT